ncbi:MAG: transcriptional repressor LexA [Planctomycetota bacterium]|jgi:repressor LexA
MDDLTQRQREVLAYIESEIHERGCAPTLREIAGHFGWRSDNSARQHLKLLQQKGVIEFDGHRSRNIRIPSAAPKTRPIPLIGRVAAGMPIEAIENREGNLGLDPNLFPEEDLFALRVRGDSMVEVGIHDGDMALVQRSVSARSGELVVALLNGEATLKRYLIEGSTPLLRAENREYGDIPIAPTDDFSIVGSVVGIVRRYR